jgi:hypothetical protein
MRRPTAPGLSPARLGVALLLCLLPACARYSHEAMRPDPFGSQEAGVVLLEVRNLLEEEVTVRIRSNALRADLGVVPPRGVATLNFRWPGLGRATFQVEPISGSRYSFPVVEVRTGESLEMTVRSPLSDSRISR